MGETILRFIPTADRHEAHEALIRAPAELVFDEAERLRPESIALIRFIFRLRAKLLGGTYRSMRGGLVEEMLGMGWGRLAYTPGRELVMGAVTQPWVGEVKFRAVPPEAFAAFNEPDLVKIAWTLEAEPLGPELTRFRTETRVQATDASARKKFNRYWRKFGIGIVLIRLLCVPALKKEAERRFRAAPR